MNSQRLLYHLRVWLTLLLILLSVSSRILIQQTHVHLHFCETSILNIWQVPIFFLIYWQIRDSFSPFYIVDQTATEKGNCRHPPPTHWQRLVQEEGRQAQRFMRNSRDLGRLWGPWETLGLQGSRFLRTWFSMGPVCIKWVSSLKLGNPVSQMQ